MSFLYDSTWWILFLGANGLMAALAAREVFRFRSMNSQFGKSTTFLAFLALPIWLVLIVTMVLLTGWLSALVGLVASFIFGQIVLRALPSFFPGDLGMGEMLAKNTFERKLAKTSVENAVLNPRIKELMQKLSLNKRYRDVYDRLRAVGLEHDQAKLAIHRPEVIGWYFNNIGGDGKFTFDQTIEFKLLAMKTREMV